MRLKIHRRHLLPLATCCFFPLAAAQEAATCDGPADLEQTIAAHPSAAAYDALGAYFARQNQLDCSVKAFESAIHLDPNSWEGHYNLGVALLSSNHTTRALQELQKASSL